MTNRARRTAVLILLAVFLAGAAAGWLLEEVVDDIDWPGLEDRDRNDSPGRSNDPLDDDAEEDFLERLGLTREQLDSVDRLLDAREDRLEAYWEARLPDIERLIDSSRAAIKELLTPEQQAAYDQWTRQQRGDTGDN